MKYNEVPDVTLKMIIESGLISSNSNVYAATDISIIGKLNSDGAIILKIGDFEKIFPFPSGAARAIVKTSVNGWKFWRLKVNDSFIELSNYKKEYENKYK